MDTIELTADVRESLRKKARLLRRKGLTPGNIYGRGLDSVSLQISTPDLWQTVRQGGRNAVINLKVTGEKKSRTAVIREIQQHPVTNELLHVDFLQVDVTRSISADVPVVLVGESPLPKGQTVISLALSTIQVQGLPMAIPRSIEADISVLEEIDQSIWVKDLPIPTGVEVLTDPDQIIVRASLARVVEEIVATEEEDAEALEESGQPLKDATNAQDEGANEA